jgi:glucose-1-phosphate thymidylyltransferase
MKVWGIIPAAGRGSRIQPLAFSKELLPIIGERDGDSVRKPRAVSDYLVERMVIGGATRICFVIAPGKSDILEYYGGTAYSATICYAVQPEPQGLCDAIFRALPLIDSRDLVLIGLPDTIWFPQDALCALPDDALSFLLFPVERPEFFDAVDADERGQVREIQVKQPAPPSNWVWGAFKMPGSVLADLYQLWCERGRSDEYVGTLVNAWIARGGMAWAVRAGSAYYDVGTMDGYLEAAQMLNRHSEEIALRRKSA